MKHSKIPVLFLAAAMSTSTLVIAGDNDDETPFDEARLFLELNDTDGDLGIHGKVDGDEWKYLEIEDPSDRKMLNLWVRGRLRRQGLTELFFESAEPTFDELDPEKFFRRFPEGEYDIEGYTLDGEERESEVYLSHVIPAAPDGVKINGMDAPEDCDGDLPEIDPTGGVTISWDQVTMSHAAKWAGDPDKIALGKDGDILLRYYEVVVEVDETDFKATAIIPPGDGDTVSWTLPEDFFVLSEEGEYKFEILVRTNILDDEGELVTVEVEVEDDVFEDVPVPGNKSAIESCFTVE
jgi:hypothetical protein